MCICACVRVFAVCESRLRSQALGCGIKKGRAWGGGRARLRAGSFRRLGSLSFGPWERMGWTRAHRSKGILCGTKDVRPGGRLEAAGGPLCCPGGAQPPPPVIGAPFSGGGRVSRRKKKERLFSTLLEPKCAVSRSRHLPVPPPSVALAWGLRLHSAGSPAEACATCLGLGQHPWATCHLPPATWHPGSRCIFSFRTILRADG